MTRIKENTVNDRFLRIDRNTENITFPFISMLYLKLSSFIQSLIPQKILPVKAIFLAKNKLFTELST